MPSEVQKLDVLIASPGDANAGRDAIERALREWNNTRGDSQNLFLRARRWEIAAVPISGHGDAQSVINSQLVDDSDIVIAIFYHRLGSATPRSVSGTVEEIDRSISKGKPVHLYFAQKRMPHDADLDQVKALRSFKELMQQRGLVGSFKTETDLEKQINRAIEHDVARFKHQLSVEPPSEDSLAVTPSTSTPGTGGELGPDEVGGKGSRPVRRMSNARTVAAALTAALFLTAIAMFIVFLGSMDKGPITGSPSNLGTSGGSQPSDHFQYLIDLDWFNEPRDAKIEAGLALAAGKRYPNSFTQSLCPHSGIRVYLGNPKYSKLKSTIFVVTPLTRNVQARVYFQRPGSSDQDILLDSISLSNKPVMINEALPSGEISNLYLTGSSPQGCLTKIAWADPEVYSGPSVSPSS
jgi:nucleoside 2-deoxyribosyltransferase